MSKNTQTSGLVNYIAHSGSIVSVSGSLTVTGSLNVTGGMTGSFQGVATTASYVLNAVSASFATTASYAVSASVATNAVTASYVLNAVSASFATTAVTSSFANAFTVAGTLTATTLVVQTITSSVLYSSGSNVFGNSLSNTQVMTGSVGITGSLAVAGTGTFSSSVQVNNASAIAKLSVFGTSGNPSTTADTNNLFSITGNLGPQLNIGGYNGASYGMWMQVKDANNAGTLYPILLQPLEGAVGIGTISPTTKLTIDNSANANTNHIDLIGNSSAGAKGHLGSFGGGTYLTSNYYYASGQNNDTGSLGQGAVIIGTSATAGASSISFALSDPGATSPSPKVNILSNGNVGIGTTNPQATLSLVGGSTLRFGNDGDSGTNTIYLRGGTTGDKGNITLNHYGYADYTISAGGTANGVFSITKTVGGTDGITINSSGEIAIGSTPEATIKLKVVGTNTGSNDYTYFARNSAGTGLFSIRNDGVGFLLAASWAYGSDRRLKENINYIQTGLNKVLALKPATFDYIDGVKNNIGWIAQDVQEVIPEAVGTISETNDQLTLKSDFIVPYLVKAIQELSAKNDALQTRITQLENK
jgi:hypothetical protein